MKKNLSKPSSLVYGSLLDRIGGIIADARRRVARAIDTTQVILYWQIGSYIVEFEQKGRIRAGYGQELLKKLALDLMNKYGRGFSERNLEQMRKFYSTYPISQIGLSKFLVRKQGGAEISQTLSAKFNLSWSHYCELLKEESDHARSFYEKEAVEERWSVRELKR